MDGQVCTRRTERINIKVPRGHRDHARAGRVRAVDICRRVANDDDVPGRHWSPVVLGVAAHGNRHQTAAVRAIIAPCIHDEMSGIDPRVANLEVAGEFIVSGEKPDGQAINSARCVNQFLGATETLHGVVGSEAAFKVFAVTALEHGMGGIVRWIAVHLG